MSKGWKKYSERDIIQMLRERKGSGTWKQLARKIGVSPQYLNDVVKRRRAPGLKISGPLGLVRIVYYRGER